MRIVYNIMGTFNSGGMERVLANKMNYLARFGHELNIVTTDQQDKQSYFELDSSIVQWDLDINYSENKNMGVLRKSTGYLNKQRLHRQRLEVLLKLLKADIVISMFDHDATFLYKIKDGSKKILEIHFSRFKRLQYARKGLIGLADRYRSKQDLKIARQYDRFVVLTQEDQAYWGNLDNIKVIPNANSFEPKRRADLTARKVIAVGRYDDQKAVDQLIHAWKYVNKVHSDWSLLIFGQGPLQAKLEKLIIELGLQDVVSLRSPVQDIESEYVNSSILAMTSRYEGLPMALLEGQACGLPLVSYDCKCGPKDIIEDGINGYLVKEGDILRFADCLISLIEDTALRIKMGNASNAKAKNFTEDIIMVQWIELFDSLNFKR